MSYFRVSFFEPQQCRPKCLLGPSENAAAGLPYAGDRFWDAQMRSVNLDQILLEPRIARNIYICNFENLLKAECGRAREWEISGGFNCDEHWHSHGLFKEPVPKDNNLKFVFLRGFYSVFFSWLPLWSHLVIWLPVVETTCIVYGMHLPA